MRIGSFEFRFEFNCEFFGSNRNWGGHRIWERNLFEVEETLGIVIYVLMERRHLGWELESTASEGRGSPSQVWSDRHGATPSLARRSAADGPSQVGPPGAWLF